MRRCWGMNKPKIQPERYFDKVETPIERHLSRASGILGRKLAKGDEEERDRLERRIKVLSTAAKKSGFVRAQICELPEWFRLPGEVLWVKTRPVALGGQPSRNISLSFPKSGKVFALLLSFKDDIFEIWAVRPRKTDFLHTRYRIRQAQRFAHYFANEVEERGW